MARAGVAVPDFAAAPTPFPPRFPPPGIPSVVRVGAIQQRSSKRYCGVCKASEKDQQDKKIEESRKFQLQATEVLAEILKSAEKEKRAEELVDNLNEEFFYIASTYLSMAKKEANVEVVNQVENALKAAMAAKDKTLRPEIRLFNKASKGQQLGRAAANYLREPRIPPRRQLFLRAARSNDQGRRVPEELSRSNQARQPAPDHPQANQRRGQDAQASFTIQELKDEEQSYERETHRGRWMDPRSGMPLTDPEAFSLIFASFESANFSKTCCSGKGWWKECDLKLSSRSPLIYQIPMVFLEGRVLIDFYNVLARANYSDRSID
ncbi:uncharacterized protein LOC9659499 [Selaginella moellendorffii]|uniref:uncharacterized protein LOC9659499 n=1 Tax=Selaginella moellendorffii TaxID=88036 RepID=UPI000D1C2396|nr:uncharacterized protein LOC9659499 [Selaginella moellendorffii]|eukprot:XP_024530005.1 uncharacterized protein LOC9659499 [Selaginella moellendorffii]